MSEVFELVIKYHSLIFFIFGIIILIGAINIYFNNPIIIKTLSSVISSNCIQDISNKWNCDLEVKYNDPLLFKSKKTNITFKDLDNEIKKDDDIVIDTSNHVSSLHIILNILIGLLLIHTAFVLYANNKNKSLQKYIGAASIVNLM
tara:strand:- start:942 stop:1379 length:438 start_codon:yes stop_codon:yes gene_type:complete